MSTPGSASTSQVVTLPHIAELFDPYFLDVLLPPPQSSSGAKIDTPEPENAFMNALKSVAHRKVTQNLAPAFNSTLSHTLDAFQSLSTRMSTQRINVMLSNAWKEDPNIALRIIWNTRSIHDGKGDKELFYRYVLVFFLSVFNFLTILSTSRAFGWLYEHHPRTAIANLSQLVAPVCVVKANSRSAQMPHGYWKDLLNILALATLDQLDSHPAPFLHLVLDPSTRGKSVLSKLLSTKEQRVGTTSEQLEASLADQAKAIARERRVKSAADSHQLLLSKLSERRFLALYVAVARLFADELVEQVALMRKVEALTDGEERRRLLKTVTLVGKWAPTPSASHDRVTNISTAIAILLHRGGATSLSRPIDTSAAVPADDVHVLRSFYQRWVLTPLRASSRVPEPLMATRRWNEVSYSHVSSICMHINSKHFLKNDSERFDAYLDSVTEGKVKISGATLLPHQLVAKAIAQTMNESTSTRAKSAPSAFRVRLAKREAQVANAQWNAMVARLREAGTLDNCLAVCDVSGSMGDIYRSSPDRTPPILPAVALSMVLAQLAKPPFANVFVTFSADPEIVTLQEDAGVAANVAAMVRTAWSMNTDLHAVFVRLLLPLAIEHRVPREEMVKRLFIFSDMQFDAAEDVQKTPGAWVTNHDAIAQAYEKAGYDVPEIVYWNLAGELETTPVDAERKGVALMSGFSPAMMKVFMGEDAEEMLDDDTVVLDEQGEEIKTQKPEITPLSIMKRALEKASYDKLDVLD